MSHSHEDETPLTRTLKALADIEATVETPSRVEAAVMARWDADLSRRNTAKRQHELRPRARTVSFIRRAATMAAGVTLLAAVALEREWRTVDVALPPSPIDRPALLPVNEPDTVSTLSQPPAHIDERRRLITERSDPPARWVLIGAPLTEDESVRIVRMRVSSSALGSLGVRDTSSVETVDIDVLVGEDGVARGVRMSM